MVYDKNENCDMCKLIEEEYEYISNRKPKWLTISPPYNNMKPIEFYEQYIEMFENFIKFSDKLIIVMEITENYRLHWHIYFNEVDSIASYKYINRFRIGNQLRIYKGGPKEGIHYLVKDVVETVKYTGLQPVILIEDLKCRRELRKVLRRKIIVEEIEKELPEWMRG